VSMATSITSHAYIRQAVDELVSKRFNTCLFYKLFLCLKVRIFPLSANETKLDVCVNGVVKEAGLLLHEADLRSPPLEVNLPQGSAADRDGTVAPM
jgi:hypothetical protein